MIDLLKSSTTHEAERVRNRVLFRDRRTGRYQISENDVWIPGIYADRATALAAFDFADLTLARLQDEVCERVADFGGRFITMEDLSRARGMADLKDIERRVLVYLDQHGPTHRAQMVADLSGPDSRWGIAVRIGRNAPNGNGAVPLIAGAWCRRLIPWGLVAIDHHEAGYYRAHAITAAGRRMLRAEELRIEEARDG